MNYDDAIKEWAVITASGVWRNDSQIDFTVDEIESVRFIGVPGLYDCDTGCEFVYTGLEITLNYGLILQADCRTEQRDLPDILSEIIAVAEGRPIIDQHWGNGTVEIEGDFGYEPTDNPWHGFVVLPKPQIIAEQDTYIPSMDEMLNNPDTYPTE